MTDRRGFLAAACGAVLAPAFGTPVLAQSSLTHITYMTPQHLLLNFCEVVVAQARGRFKQQGLDVSIQGGNGAPQALQQVLSGQVQVGRIGGNVMLAAAAKGVPAKAISTISHAAGYFLFSAKSKPIKTAADVAGATIGVASTDGPFDNALTVLADEEKLDNGKIERQVVADNVGGFGLIASGRIKGFLGSYSTYALAEANNVPFYAMDVSKYMPLPGQVYVATNDMIAKSPAILTAFLRGLRAGISDIVADKTLKSTIELLKPYNVEGLDNEEAAVKTIRFNQRLWFSAGEANVLRNVPAEWTRGVEESARAGFAPVIPNDKLFTNALVDEALNARSHA